MCGITGYYNFDCTQQIPSSTLQKMTKVIAHRGPDDSGCFLMDRKKRAIHAFRDHEEQVLVHGHIGLGHRRLSILDLSPRGHQPMFSKDGNIVLSFNGEIYNYIELREELKKAGYTFTTGTDTEVVIAAYQAWGTTCFKKFNGMWALALYDVQAHQLLLSRDRYGKKPLYYYQKDNVLVFSSEIKSIFQYPDIPKSPNLKKLVNYCGRHYRYVDNNNESFFQDILQVPKSTYMTFSDTGKVTTDTYWSLEPFLNIRTKISEAEAVEQFLNLLEDAVKIRMRSDVPVGFFLSGGMDSTSIVALAAKLSKNLQTFSGVTGDGYYNETEYIEEIIKHTGVQSTFVYPKPEALFPTVKEMLGFHDEPICTITWYSMYLMTKETAKSDITVILTGHGGDELLAGYWDHYHYHFHGLNTNCVGDQRELKKWQENYRRSMDEYHRMKSYIPSLQKDRTLEFGRYSKYLNCLSPKLQLLDTIPNEVYNVSCRDELTRRLYLEAIHETIPTSLRVEDRNFMAFSIENRVPFLDYRLAEFCFGLDNSLKIQNGFGKHLLRKATKNILPDKVRLRKDKVGFNAPADEWFRNENRQEIEALLTRKNFVNEEIYNIKETKQIFKRHLEGENHYMFIWQFINTHLWYERFFN